MNHDGKENNDTEVAVATPRRSAQSDAVCETVQPDDSNRLAISEGESMCTMASIYL